LGIRGKLLLLAAGIAVPLVVVGALDLRNMWQLSRSQLNDSVKQQVELASVALERWLEISVRTVENHISHILEKKGFNNRVEIARYVLERRE
jgi:sensor domain CHASE-containing protein